MPRHNASLLRLLLAQLADWEPSGQLELSGTVQRLVFHSSVALLFGPRFLGLPDGAAQPEQAAGGGHGKSKGTQRADRLRQDFFAFEAGFELAASPVPHLLQPRFLAARRRLLAALRCERARPARPAALLPPCRFGRGRCEACGGAV